MSDCVQSSLMSSSSATFLPSGNYADPIDNSIRKQSSSKLVNRYLSTAAQYLNRSKSFHIPSSTTTTNNNNQSDRIIPCHDDRHFFLYHADLRQRSIPMNIDRMNRLHRNDADPSILVLPPTHSPTSIEHDEKSHGFVNTLRRSLRKNKDRFSTKRTTNPLHHNEMTPTIQRRQTDLSSWIATTPKTRSNTNMNRQNQSNVCADEIHLSGK